MKSIILYEGKIVFSTIFFLSSVFFTIFVVSLFITQTPTTSGDLMIAVWIFLHGILSCFYSLHYFFNRKNSWTYFFLKRKSLEEKEKIEDLERRLNK